MDMKFRVETDALGDREIPADCLWGIHTQRARENFFLSGVAVRPELLAALAVVKKACCLANAETGFLAAEKAAVIARACDEISRGEHSRYFPVDALQGGAGTSTNMNMNEVIANRALVLLGRCPGEYALLHPLRDVNMHQSTNDVFPTAVKVAVLRQLQELSDAAEGLQQALQAKEQEFASIVKTGRTELQAAVPLTLGAEFSAFSEAVARDRWRIAHGAERIRCVNLGGTAVGTGLAAPRRYIFLVTETLRALTGLSVSRAENLVDQTANSDGFVEVAGIVRTHAANVLKISNDLRLLNLLGEIQLAPVQTGSSLMPGKVNPVIPEAVMQAGLKADAALSVVFECASRSSLQINEFMPLLADSVLTAVSLLQRADRLLSGAVAGITADAAACRAYVEQNPATVTAFLPLLGYEECERIVAAARQAGGDSLLAQLREKLGTAVVNTVLSAERLTGLGYRDDE